MDSTADDHSFLWEQRVHNFCEQLQAYEDKLMILASTITVRGIAPRANASFYSGKGPLPGSTGTTLTVLLHPVVHDFTSGSRLLDSHSLLRESRLNYMYDRFHLSARSQLVKSLRLGEQVWREEKSDDI